LDTSAKHFFRVVMYWYDNDYVRNVYLYDRCSRFSLYKFIIFLSPSKISNIPLSSTDEILERQIVRTTEKRGRRSHCSRGAVIVMMGRQEKYERVNTGAF